MRRRAPWWVLAALFVVLPLLEIYLLIQVGQVVGAWWTLLLLVAAGILGSYLVKREGSRAWRSLQRALREHRPPARELADGALILIGGTLLLTPGFLTDLVGLFAILPLTRPLARVALTRAISKRLLGAVAPVPGAGAGFGHAFDPGFGSRGSEPRTARRPGTDETVVRGEVVED